MKIRLTIVLDGKRHAVNVSAYQLTRHGLRGLFTAVLQRMANGMRRLSIRVQQYATSLEK